MFVFSNFLKTLRFAAEVWFLWALCLLLNIIAFLFIYYKISPSSQTLALHYNVLVGVEWYGKGYNLYLIPVAGLAILAVNFFLYRALGKTKSFLPYLTVFASLSVQLLLLLALLMLSVVN